MQKQYSGSKSSTKPSIVVYEPKIHFPLLERLFDQASGNASLGNRSFVNWYYGSSKERCCLLLAMQGDELVGTIGAEAVEFETNTGERFRVGFGQNFFSFVPGVGARLFFHASKVFGGGVSFGAAPASQHIVKRRRWVEFGDVYEWSINPLSYSEQIEPGWKAAARALRARLLRVDLRTLASQAAAAGFSPCEVRRLSEYPVGISPDQTEFSWRFRPSLEHLRWRYPLQDGPLRYRAYQVERAGERLGFVILSWRPGQVIAAHVDVVRRADYVPAVVHSIAAWVEENVEERYASVRFSLQQGSEDALLLQTGFRKSSKPTFFAVGPQGDGYRVEIPRTGGNFSLGMGDNDLRVPFWEDVLRDRPREDQDGGEVEVPVAVLR